MRIKVSDEQIDRAMGVAMRKALERETDERVRAQMQADIERYEAGEHLPPEVQVKFRQAVRDFLVALFTTPTPKMRRRARRGRA